LLLGVQAFFQSLSLASASLLVAFISGVAASLVGRIDSAVARWFVAVLFPFGLAYSVYWMPVWLGADGSEYLAWSLLGVGIPFMAGLVPSVVVTFLVSRRAQRHA
jgi:hypothetical protein